MAGCAGEGPESEYFDWFMINQWPFDQTDRQTRDGKFYSFAFAANMPKLNTNNTEVIRYISDVCAYWVEKYQIDGIRFDVGNEVSHRLLKELRSRLKAIRPDIYLLGEIWHDASQWLAGDEYDSVMNYPLTGSIQDFFMDKSSDNVGFEHMINRLLYHVHAAEQQCIIQPFGFARHRASDPQSERY